MPRNEYSTPFALMSDVDMRSFSGTLYTRVNSLGNTINVSLPTTSQIVFDDPLHFFNGNGLHSQCSLKRAFELIFTGETFQVGMSSDDKLWINRTNATSLTVTNASNVSLETYGIVNGIYNSGYVEGQFDWKRGSNTRSSEELLLIEGEFPKIVTFPHIKTYQTLPQLFSVRSGTGDYCLESVEHDLFYTGTGVQPFITWGLNDNGHVYQEVFVPSSNQYLRTFQWVNDDFRKRLGFSGMETFIQLTGETLYYRMTADNPMPGVLIPTRPLNDIHIEFDRLSYTKRLYSGRYATNFINNYVKSVFSFYLDAYADIKNEYRHYTDACGEYFYDGARVSLYQDWGDNRLTRITSDIDVNSTAYSLQYTSEKNGSFGVIRGTLKGLSNVLTYPGAIRRRVPITMEIEHDK